MSEIKAVCDICGKTVVIYVNKFRCDECKAANRDIKWDKQPHKRKKEAVG